MNNILLQCVHSIWNWKKLQVSTYQCYLQCSGKRKSHSTTNFHSVTGCDTTSTFFGKGKKSAWHAWKAFPEVTKAFLYMASNPHVPLNIESEEFKLLDCFCVIIYDKTSSLEYVNEARRELFCRNIEQWKQFHQHKMLFCSTVEEVPTRLAFGAHVTELIRSCRAQKDMAGH